MVRRRKREDLITPPSTPDKMMTHNSGWCMTEYHEECKYQFDSGKCPCECHLSPSPVSKKQTKVTDDSKTQKTRRPRKPIANIGFTEEVNNVTDHVSDPRPWRNK